MPNRRDYTYAWHFQTRELSKVFNLVNTGCTFYAYNEVAGLYTGIARWEKPKSQLTIQLLTEIPFVKAKKKEEKYSDILDMLMEPTIYGTVPLDPRERGIKTSSSIHPILKAFKSNKRAKVVSDL